MIRFLRLLRRSWKTWWPVYICALIIIGFDLALYFSHHLTISQLITGASGKAKIALAVFFVLLGLHWFFGWFDTAEGV